jgi:tetratricopeptide (TPR) repeat protein
LVQAEEAWREILELTKGLTHDANMAVVYHNFGQELESVRAPLGRIIAIYRESIRLNNANASTHYGLGNALKAANQPDQAIIEYREALRLQNDYPEVHVNLGNILVDRNELDDAIAEYRAGLATKLKFSEAYKAHNGLGNALKAKGQPEKAIASYQTAIRLNNNFAEAHYGLGNVYFPKRLDEAIAEYREAIRIKPHYAEARTNLGNSLAVKGELDEAITQYRKAIQINKTLFEAHTNLGRALQDKGQLEEAIAEYRQALRINKDHARTQAHLLQAERLAQLDKRLPAVLKGTDRPKDAEETLDFARLCQGPSRRQYAAGARFYEKAFAAEPKLAEFQGRVHRYDAACAAALAGSGQGTDADKLDDAERARLRRQALDWMRANLEAVGHLLDKTPDMAPALAGALKHWQADSDFAGVRGPGALSKLPKAERQPWEKLWKDVDDVLKRAQEKATQEKR